MSSARKRKPSQKGTSFFAKKRAKSASKTKTGKTYRAEEQKDRFVKPPHDPGPKIRPEEGDVIEEYSVEEGGNVVQQALQNSGCGCCGSITSFIWFLGIGAMIAFIILVVKCGGC